MTTTTTVLPAPVQQSFSYKLLSVPVPYFIHNIPAMLKNMPRNGGTTLRMRRYNPLLTATVPLGNSGVTPPPQQLTAVNIDAEIDFYGTYIILNEQVTLQNQDPVLNEAAQRLGVSLRQTEDELTRNMLASTASFINCVGGTNGDNPTELTRSDIDVIIRTLADNNAYTIADNIEGEDRFGTAPIRDAYFALGSTQLIGDLEQVNGFIAKAQYPSPMLALRPEWGSVSNLRFLLSSIGSITTAGSNLGNDVYNIFCVGMEAYAVVEQDGYSSQFIYRPPIYDGPLALNASVGYKFAQVPRITNDAWVLNLRATLSV
jgi:N4-gp56 family major capsid protein